MAAIRVLCAALLLLPVLALVGCCCKDFDLEGAYKVAQGTSSEADYVQVSAAMDYTCALGEDGEVTCWGCKGYRDLDNRGEYSTDQGQCEPPAGPFEAIDAAQDFACGLRGDGSVECWGHLVALSMDRTPPAGPFTAIAVDDWNSCALAPDGSLACWGCKLPARPTGCDPPAGTYASITGGRTFHCALDADGAATCWAGTAASPDVLYTVPKTTFKTVSLVEDGGCGARTDGTTECWGDHPAQVVLDPVQLASGRFLTCGVTSDHLVRCWTAWNPEPWEPDLGGNAAEHVSVGYDHGCVLTTDHRVVCFGEDDQRQASPP
jgi:Regulator of chromosome condensation (RCC1) repeat